MIINIISNCLYCIRKLKVYKKKTGTNQRPTFIIDFGHAQKCDGVKLVLLDPNPLPVDICLYIWSASHFITLTFSPYMYMYLFFFIYVKGTGNFKLLGVCSIDKSEKC